tara:strand:+ start:172 stop:378 length:207 start_codon:yes stop_codon:yes gene_type:complete
LAVEAARRVRGGGLVVHHMASEIVDADGDATRLYRGSGKEVATPENPVSNSGRNPKVRPLASAQGALW